MKSFCLFLFSVLSINLCLSQTTAITDTNFEQELIAQGIDTNGLNGNILNTDAQAVTALILSGTNISDITGINAFVNLTDLDLGDNPVLNIAPTALTGLLNLTSDNNDALISVNLSQNVLLQTLLLESDINTAGDPPITTVDLSQNINLVSVIINFLRDVTDLILPVTNTLDQLILSSLSDPTIDVSLLDGLEDLDIRGSQVSTAITLPNEASALRELYISSLNINVVDVSNYINLERLDLFSTYVEDLILPTTNTFRRLTIWTHNFINPVSLANVPEVTYVDIRNNQTVPLVIDLLSNPLIETLWLTNNDLNIIDLTNIIALETLWIYNNNLTTLDVTQNLLLERLWANDNLLPEIDLTQNTLLRYLNLSDNQIPNLDLTQNTVVWTVDISNNLFTTKGLDLTQNVEMSSFRASFNQIESLDITQNIDLRTLIVDNNLFTGTSILDQFYTIRLNDGGIRGGDLIVSYNMLSGQIPDFASLIAPYFNVSPIRFDLAFDNNNFEFGHFENEHADYVLYDNTFGPPPSWTSIPNIDDYFYAPQAKVDTIDTITVNAGDSVTLTTVCAGSQNHYTWFKDGVAIPGAPDSPNYTIPFVDSCDAAVYHSEITSDLVPFENSSPPGTNGKNLLLIRNDITLNVISPTQDCVTLIAPVIGSTNVALNTTLEWTENLGACGYFLSIGSTSGATDILNNFDVGDSNSYNIGSDFPPNTQIFVTITPYYNSGVPLSCPEVSFTTSTTVSPTVCTTLTMPLDGDIDVPLTSNIQWDPSPFATGYTINMGTTTGGTDLANAVDVGNTTFYNPAINFPESTIIYVTIIPYNSLGNATGCIEQTFTTFGNNPSCTALVSPLDAAGAVLVTTDLTWNPITDATGYYLTVGTTSGGIDIINNLDVGNSTTYNLPADLPYGTQIFVTITPYNVSGNAIGCVEESFITEVIIPICTNLISPLNGAVNVSIATDISWIAISNATGYFLTVGTSSGGTEILNNQDVGNVTTYNLPTDLPDETPIFVSITPYNSAGNAIGCLEESFTTEVVIPSCTSLISPLNGAVDVSIATDISWTAISNATGYFLTVGTTSGDTDIINTLDVGNSTTYNLPTDLPGETPIFVSITPYNSAGSAIGCLEDSFITELPLPFCSNLISPFYQELDVSVNTNLTWSASTFAEGYTIAIGTATGMSDIMATTDVGNVTTFTPPMDLLSNTLVFVTISAYNASGATVCGDDQFTTEDLTPLCVNLVAPYNGDTNVALNTNITWQSDANADSYLITMGTTPGGNDLVNAVDVGNVTTYNYPLLLPQNTQIFVTITPYNTLGQAIGCSEQSFTTQLLIPECTSILAPFNGENNVSITTDLSWAASPYAEGYIVTAGTFSGGSDLVNAVDVGNTTTYAFAENWPDQTAIYVTISAYNSVGNAVNCSEVYFTTETIVPECTYLTTPINNETEVSVTTILSWNAISNATGYLISVGTTANGTDIINTLDLGNTTSFQPTETFSDNTTIYVSITPYNSAGTAIGCTSEQFTIENRSIITPQFFTPNGDIYNQYWKVTDPKNEIKSIHIFDRFGKLITRLNSNSQGWDGTFKGDNLPTSDYWYVLELFNGTFKRGHFTLKR